MATVINMLINTQMSIALTSMTSTTMISTTNTTIHNKIMNPITITKQIDMQGSLQQEPSKYEETETSNEANADFLIEEDDESTVYNDGFIR
jgi:hypothetical protein